jgi:hypothetical protein
MNWKEKEMWMERRKKERGKEVRTEEEGKSDKDQQVMGPGMLNNE